MNSSNYSMDNIKMQSQQGYKKIIFLFTAFLFIIVFRTTVLERTIIKGNSMNPTLTDGDVCITMKFNVNPQRYNLVVAKVSGQTIIKRVIGLPGDTLQIIDGTVYINGKPIEKYNFFTEDMGVLESPYIIGKNTYFLMGDNRAESYDSRELGSINIENIKGIVLCKFYPLPIKNLLQ